MVRLALNFSSKFEKILKEPETSPIVELKNSLIDF